MCPRRWWLCPVLISEGAAHLDGPSVVQRHPRRQRQRQRHPRCNGNPRQPRFLELEPVRNAPAACFSARRRRPSPRKIRLLRAEQELMRDMLWEMLRWDFRQSAIEVRCQHEGLAAISCRNGLQRGTQCTKCEVRRERERGTQIEDAEPPHRRLQDRVNIPSGVPPGSPPGSPQATRPVPRTPADLLTSFAPRREATNLAYHDAVICAEFHRALIDAAISACAISI